MRPDGSGTKEIYGNDIQFPPTMLHGRQIPGQSNLFVMLGTPHYPQSGIGTVIRVDTTKNIRTRDPMTYVTPHVDIRQEAGWNHLVDGRWVRHTNGPLYMDPFPLADFVKLVTWVDANAAYYGSYWGRLHLGHKGHPNFRPVPTLRQALSTAAPLPDEQR